MWTKLLILLSRVQGLFSQNRGAGGLDQELESHLALLTEENVRRGMTPEEARLAARRTIGAAGPLREHYREQRGLPRIETLFQDLQYGWRTLRKSPAFAAVAIATLALGIGANTTIFSVAQILFLKPLPYPEPDRLVNVWGSRVGQPGNLNILSAPNFLDWREQSHVFEQMALFDSAGKGYDLSGDKDAERVRGLRVSASLFPALGIQPHLGRTFTAEEETLGRNNVVVLSYALWERRYAADPGLVGRDIRIDGRSHRVVGVMPPQFEFDFGSSRNQLWVPIGFDSGDRQRGSNSFGACARLKAGVSMAQAQAEMDTIGRRLAAQYPETNEGWTVALTPLFDLGIGNLKPTFTTLFTVVGFVLLIACANVANLMLARGAARQKELALRRALGASRLRIVRQLLTESILLALLGGAAGLVIAAAGTRLLETLLPQYLGNIPFRHLEKISIDRGVLLFTLLIGCLTGVLFGLVSAWNALRMDVNEPLKEGQVRGSTGRGGRLRHVLVAAEVALALGVLAGAGLMLESMSRLVRVDPGLDAKNLLTMSVSLPQPVLYYSPPLKANFCRDFSERASAIPGVLSVSAVSHLPIGGGNAGRSFTVQGRPAPAKDAQPNGGYSVQCPDYFKTMGIPLRGGREFTHQDMVNSQPVVMINEAAAKRYWPNENPVGQRFKLGGFGSDNPWMLVIGVAGDVRHSGLHRDPRPEIYRPYTQGAWPSMTLVIRTASSPTPFAVQIKAALLSIDPDQAASGVITMEEVVHRSMGSRRIPTLLLTTFGFLSLILAAIGIAGVVSYSVAQRSHEIGIRIALGAGTMEVLRLVIGRSMSWTFAGVILGIAASFGLTRLMTGLLFGVKPMDPTILGAAAVLLAAVAFLASYVPARTATKVDPINALRCD